MGDCVDRGLMEMDSASYCIHQFGGSLSHGRSAVNKKEMVGESGRPGEGWTH